jgi:hypothetical protein
MQKSIRLLIILSLQFLTAAAQEEAKGKPAGGLRFRSYNAVAWLVGEQAAYAAVQTVNGINRYGFFTGLGTGIDFYRMRSVPVFLDLRYEAGRGKRKLFIYGDIGSNLPWVSGDTEMDWVNISQDFDAGWYGDVGLGGRTAYGKRGALFLSAGLTMKSMRETRVSTNCGFAGCEDYTEKFEYRYGRLSLKLGWMF